MNIHEKISRKKEICTKIANLQAEIKTLEKNCSHPKEIVTNHGSHREGELEIHTFSCQLCNKYVKVLEDDLKDWDGMTEIDIDN